MNSKIKKTVIILLLLVLTMPLITFQVSAHTPVYVDDDAAPGWYDHQHVKTVAEGIANVSTGGELYILAGHYNEHSLEVTKHLTIMGVSPETVIIDATNSSYLMEVTSDYVNISGITFYNAKDGLLSLYNGQYCSVTDCHFTLSWNGGISIGAEGGGLNTTIANCEISNINFNPGISCLGGSNIIIATTEITNCHSEDGNTGISLNWVHDCQINGCTITDCDYGIGLTAINTIVKSNDIHDCDYGLTIGDMGEYESGNLIFNNYFDCTIENADDQYTNSTWNTTKQLETNIIGGPYIGGNYWSDYTGDDTNSDGLGDTDVPYDTGITHNGDYLPLLYGWTPPIFHPPTFGTPSPINNSIGIDPSVTWYWTIPINDSGVHFGWTIDFDGYETGWANPYASNGTASFGFSPGDLAYGTTYRMWVNATDGVNTTRAWYQFTTMPGPVYVDDDADPSWYDASHVHTIQEGIDNVTAGGIVYVWDGSYPADTFTNKTISIIGNGTTTVNINGNYKMTINASHVNISGIHFSNCSQYSIRNYDWSGGSPYCNINYTAISHCFFTDEGNTCIYFHPNTPFPFSVGINISNNYFYNLVGGAIEATSIDYGVYTNNIISHCNHGMYLGLNNNSDIAFNNISYTDTNEAIGIWGDTHCFVYNNTLKYGNWTSIYGDLAYDIITNNCTIYNNIIIGYNGSGCHGIEMYASEDNLIYNNYFCNTLNAYDEGTNRWNTTKTLGTNIIGGPYLGGNYWSDYTGVDTTVDGLGDTNIPYNGGGEIANGGDYHPLVQACYVDDDASPSWYDTTHVHTIQEGINNVSAGGTVHVWDGTYYNEPYIVNKSVTLIGNSSTSTILQYNGGTSPIYQTMVLEADNIVISGFHFNGSGDFENFQINAPDSVRNISIVNCLFTNTYDTAINMWNAVNYNINISGNEFHNPYQTNFSSCIQINANNCSIYNNVATGLWNLFLNSYGGDYYTVAHNVVTANSGLIFFNDNHGLIFNNTITGNVYPSSLGDGMDLDTCNNFTISDTVVTGWNGTYKDYGIWISDSYNCLIYNNYFANNRNNSYDTGNNKWNITKTLGTNIIGGPYIGGNYWSDYAGSDITGDGLGDTYLPYNSSGNILTGGDYHPLVQVSDCYVDDDASPSWYDTTHVHTIQEGINNVSAGGTVHVWDGTYTENISVNKPVTIIGNGSTATTLVEHGQINITSDDVSISDIWFNSSAYGGCSTIDNFEDSLFFINHIHIFNCRFTNFSSAIDIEQGGSVNTDINVSNNVFVGSGTGVSFYAIVLWGADNLYIYHNTLSNCTNGISTNNNNYANISYNTITDSGDGNAMEFTPTVTHFRIFNNTLLRGAGLGIYLESSDNSIYNNRIIGFNGTGFYGIKIYDSENNLIYNNYFSNINNSYDDGTNKWNTTKTLGTNIVGGSYLGGNYWSDYTGVDNTGDGLGDTDVPYNSKGNITTGGDYLPLVVSGPTSLSITVSPNATDFGVVAIGESAYTTDYHYNLTNLGMECDVAIQFNDSQNWIASAYAGIGYNAFSMNFSDDNWATETNIDPIAGTTINTYMAQFDYKLFDLKVIMPTASGTTHPQDWAITFIITPS